MKVEDTRYFDTYVEGRTSSNDYKRVIVEFLIEIIAFNSGLCT